jgi:hypothetical protein
VKKWPQYSDLAKDFAVLVNAPDEIGGVGSREAAVFMARLGLRALHDTKGFSLSAGRNYAKAVCLGIQDLIDDLRPSRSDGRPLVCARDGPGRGL